MAHPDACVTIHMVASLDGFIARTDGRVDWLEVPDEFEGGDTLDPEFVRAFLQTIDCYVMGSRTYETALAFEGKGLGWAYGDTPTFVLTSRPLPKTRDSVEFYAGDLTRLVNERLKPSFRGIWFVGGGVVAGECLRLGLANEVRYSIVPILIGEGIPFFTALGADVALHLVETKAYKSGMVALRYEVRPERHDSAVDDHRRRRRGAQHQRGISRSSASPTRHRPMPTSGRFARPMARCCCVFTSGARTNIRRC